MSDSTDDLYHVPRPALLVVISGPSGVGKEEGTVLSAQEAIDCFLLGSGSLYHRYLPGMDWLLPTLA